METYKKKKNPEFAEAVGIHSRKSAVNLAEGAVWWLSFYWQLTISCIQIR